MLLLLLLSWHSWSTSSFSHETRKLLLYTYNISSSSLSLSFSLWMLSLRSVDALLAATFFLYRLVYFSPYSLANAKIKHAFCCPISLELTVTCNLSLYMCVFWSHVWEFRFLLVYEVYKQSSQFSHHISERMQLNLVS